MIVFPNCKINLGLNILRKRSDGYHDLETVYYPVPFTESLEIILNKNSAINSGIHFSCSGLPIKGEPSSNLCVKASQLLQKDFPGMPALQMHLHKVIPTGAGLGGGSADGAFVLKLLNQLLELGLSKQQLIQYASQLGSDCPFFIINKPCFAQGRGEILEEIPLDLSAYKLILVHPGIHIDTKSVFSTITPRLPEKPLGEILAGSIEKWKDELSNDFETTIFQQHPEIAAIKDNLYDKGAIYASLSGSGSTVYGLFLKEHQPQLLFPANYLVKELFS